MQALGLPMRLRSTLIALPTSQDHPFPTKSPPKRAVPKIGMVSCLRSADANFLGRFGFEIEFEIGGIVADVLLGMDTVERIGADEFVVIER